MLRDGAHLLNIDHHHDNTRFGTLNHVVADASCTAEIVWDLMRGLGVRPTPAVAEALYIGLITDTGASCTRTPARARTEMAAELIEAGVDVPRRLPAPVRGHADRQAHAARRSRSRAMQRFDAGELTLVALSAEDFARAEAEESYSEGIIDQLRALQGTKVAVLVRELSSGERKGQHKVSLRATDDDVDVSIIARAQGGGGPPPRGRLLDRRSSRELIAFLRGAIAAQLHPLRRTHRRHGRLSAARASAAADGRRAADRQARRDDLARRRRGRAPLAGRASRPATRARSTRSRPACCSCCVGRATNPSSELMALPKRYETVARLGALSSTGDTEGEITETGRIPPEPPALPTGEIRQRPPMHSAVKIGGERAYRRARRGESFEMPERIVTVHRFEQLWRERATGAAGAAAARL